MAIKSSRGVTSGKGTPQNKEGQNGDITVRSTPLGKKLYVKDSNKWGSINLDIDAVDLQKKVDLLLNEVRRLKNKTRNKPSLDAAILRKPGSADIQLKNNSGALNIRNAADDGDVELSTTYTAAKCTDATANNTATALKALVGESPVAIDIANDSIIFGDADGVSAGQPERTVFKSISTAMAGAGLAADGSTGVLSVGVDDTTVEINSDALRLKAGGIDTTHLTAATLVIQSEGIGSNNNDTTIPTSAAVKAYADSVGGAVDVTGSPSATEIATWSDEDTLQGISTWSIINGGKTLYGLLPDGIENEFSPNIELTNNNDDGSSAQDRHGPAIYLKNLRNGTSAGEPTDVLGSFIFHGRNDAVSPEEIRYGKIDCQITSPSDGAEYGSLYFRLINDGAEQTSMTLTSAGLTINNITDGGGGDNFLVEESGIIKKRTAAQTLNDIGAMPDSGNITIAGTLSITDTGSPPLKVAYDANHFATFDMDTNGVLEIECTDGGSAESKLQLKNGGTTSDQYLVWGNSSETARITSNGAQNLVLNVNEGTNSGYIEIQGDAANGDITISPHGTGNVILSSVQFADNVFLDSNGNPLFNTAVASSAVNDVEFGNAATGNSPTIKAIGTDSDVDLTLGPKGKGKIFIDKNTSGDAAANETGLHIDFDRTVASSGTNNHNDIGIDLDINSASLGTSSAKGMDIDVVGATSGTHTASGIELNVSGADVNTGLTIVTENGASNHDITLKSSANASDYFTINTNANAETTIATIDADAANAHLTLFPDGILKLKSGQGQAMHTILVDNAHNYYNDTNLAAYLKYESGDYTELVMYEQGGDSNDDFFKCKVEEHGATTISTIDGAASAANLILDIDGSIEFNSANGNFIAKKAGTEFSIANSAYAGMIIGYSSYFNTTATVSYNTITISTSMTVLETENNNKVNIVFTAPPSGNVEIELSCMAYGSSKEIMFSLSDAATYNELDQIHTYDDVGYKMDETDYDIVDTKFVVTGLTAGNSYQYWLAAKSSSNSAYIYHGKSRVNSHTHPIIVKAVALPGTITTGT